VADREQSKPLTTARPSSAGKPRNCLTHAAQRQAVRELIARPEWLADPRVAKLEPEAFTDPGSHAAFAAILAAKRSGDTSAAEIRFQLERTDPTGPDYWGQLGLGKPPKRGAVDAGEAARQLREADELRFAREREKSLAIGPWPGSERELERLPGGFAAIVRPDPITGLPGAVVLLRSDNPEVGPFPEVSRVAVTRDAAGSILTRLYVMALDGGKPEPIADADLLSAETYQRFGVAIGTDRKSVDAMATAVRYLAAALGEPEDCVPCWRGGQLYIPAGEIGPAGIGTRSDLAEPDAIAAWRAALELAAASAPRALLPLGAAFGAPYLAPFDRMGFTLHLVGDARKGKSTALLLGAAALGDPRLTLGGFNGTALGLGERRAALGVLPEFVDELGAAKLTEADLEADAFRVSLGLGRTRSRRQGGSVTGAGWRSVRITSGNSRIASGSANPGLAARVVNVHGPITLTADTARELAKLARSAYGWPLAWLAAAPDLEGTRARFAAADLALGAEPGGVAGTVAEHLAACVAGLGRLADRVGAPELAAAALAAAVDVLADLSAELAEAGESVGARLAEAIRQDWSLNPTRYVESWADARGYGPVSGVVDRPGSRLSVLAAVLRQLAADHGIPDPVPGLRELAESGELLRPGDAKGGLSRHVRGMPGRCYVFSLALLDPDPDDGEPDESPEPPAPTQATTGPEPEGLPLTAEPSASRARLAPGAGIREPRFTPAHPAHPAQRDQIADPSPRHNPGTDPGTNPAEPMPATDCRPNPEPPPSSPAEPSDLAASVAAYRTAPPGNAAGADAVRAALAATPEGDRARALAEAMTAPAPAPAEPVDLAPSIAEYLAGASSEPELRELERFAHDSIMALAAESRKAVRRTYAARLAELRGATTPTTSPGQGAEPNNAAATSPTEPTPAPASAAASPLLTPCPDPGARALRALRSPVPLPAGPCPACGGTSRRTAPTQRDARAEVCADCHPGVSTVPTPVGTTPQNRRDAAGSVPAAREPIPRPSGPADGSSQAAPARRWSPPARDPVRLGIASGAVIELPGEPPLELPDRGSAAEVLELAAAHGIGHLAIFPSSLAHLGLPLEPPPTTGPRKTAAWLRSAKAAGWSLTLPGLAWWNAAERDGTEVCLHVPSWDRDADFAGTDDPATLRAALEGYSRAVGEPFRWGSAATADALLRHCGPGYSRLGESAEAGTPGAEDGYLEADYAWARPLTDAERAGLYVHALDRSASYLAAAESLELGIGTPEHGGPADAADLARPGYWRVVLPTGAVPDGWPDPFHPAPTAEARELPDGSRWAVTPTLELAAELGLSVAVLESVTWPEHRRALATWAARLRDAREILIADPSPAAELARLAVKRTYTAGIGRLGKADRAPQVGAPAHALYRPSWRAAIIGKARCNVARALLAASVAPFAVRNDCAYYIAAEPDPAAFGASIGLKMGTSPGRFKVDGSAGAELVGVLAQTEPGGILAALEALPKRGPRL
jgi:hypothetical protein